MNRSLIFCSLSVVAVGALTGAARVATSSGQAGALVRLQPSAPGVVQQGNTNVSGISRAMRFESNSSLNFLGSSTGNSIIAESTGLGTPAIVGNATNGNGGGVWGRNLGTGTYGLLGWGNIGVLGNNGGNDANWAGFFQGRVHVRDGLGVGTDSPAALLHVNGSALFSGDGPKAIAFDNAGNLTLELGAAAGGGHYSTSALANDGVIRNAFGGSLHFLSGSGAAAVTITPANRVGVGTSSPTAKLTSSVPGFESAMHAFSNGQTSASTHPSGSFWPAAIEGAGPNGIIGGTTESGGYGVVGTSPYLGVYGGAQGTTSTNYGVYGYSASTTNGYAVYASGRTGASGTKSFRIDHPSDPLNRYLLHYSAEGPEPQNIYNGTVTTDANGEAWIELPSYYADINKEPRYQLTVVDDTAGPGFVQVKVARKIKGNRFMIMTSAPNIEVCWEVKAVRNDAFVQKYGAPVEVEKDEREKGTYQHPELYGAPKEMGVMATQRRSRETP